MAKSARIRVMISSRCNDVFPPAPAKGGLRLSDIRVALKSEIESMLVFGHPVFEVWINETAPPAAHDNDSWDKCLEQARDCDVMIVLSNGNSGWAKTAGDIGICHAEYMEGLSVARNKVWLISLSSSHGGTAAERARNSRFQAYLNRQSAFRGGEVKTVDQLKARIKEALCDALVSLTQRGVFDARSARFDTGQALDWSRLDFRERKAKMEGVLEDAFLQRTGAMRSGHGVLVTMASISVLVVPHAIPAALSIAAARELVGRPFLQDHDRAVALKASIGGPVHVIACHKTATETQAMNVLGFPDATIVPGDFGIYVADNVQKVQFVFIVNCRDEARTRHGIQRFFEWLEQTDEDKLLAQRALSRARIVRTIANEVTKP